MIILGLVLLLLGLLLGIGILWVLGVITLVIGLVLLLLGTVASRPVGGRTHWW